MDLTVAVIAKECLPGRVKTRMSPPLSPEGAAALAQLSLSRTLETVRLLPARDRVQVLDGRPKAADDEGCPVVPHGTRRPADRPAGPERHVEASIARLGENDPPVVAADQDVADAIDLYDDALLEAYGEVTPLVIYNGDDEEDDDLDDDDDDDELDDHSDDEGDGAGVYLGLDDSDYDEEPSTTR